MEISTYQYPRTFDVVVADDSEDALALVQLVLQNPSLQFRPCKNGQMVIDACRERLPDLAILDVLMPEKNGIEACQWIKENCGATFLPVILLTCQSDLSDKIHGLNCGADEYITKPFSIPELEARVRAILRIKDLTDKLQETKNLLAEKEKQILTMQVAGAAAHELGQPLTAMLLHCTLISKMDKENPEFKKALLAIEDYCLRMRNILEQLNSVKDYKITQYADDLSILDLSSPRSS